MPTEPIAVGRVESLALNGVRIGMINFLLSGPVGDTHAGFARRLGGHDGEYMRTSALTKGANVLNWRTWTGLSREELVEVENELDVGIPPGCLLENIIVSGIPGFSQLAPTSRLVFPARQVLGGIEQAILAVWEENSPCSGVGRRLEAHHGIDGLSRQFIRAAQKKRGVMGLVLAPGSVQEGDEILVYPPVPC